jgi:hypothetical protein
MSLDGSGNYVPPSPPAFPAVLGTTISSVHFNAIILDIAAALSKAVYRDGQAVMLADLDMGGHSLINVGGTGLAPTTIQTLTALATYAPAVGETALYVNRFSAASQYARALYVLVAANPGHGLSAQASDGSWWEIGESEITPEMAGHIAGTNVKVAAQLANAVGRTVMFQAREYLTKDTRITKGGKITGKPGHVIRPFDNDTAATSTNYGFAILTNDITIEGLNCQGQAAVVDTITNGLGFLPPLYLWIGVVRQTEEGGILRRRNITIHNNTLFGAQHGIIATSIEGSKITNNRLSWNHYWGIVLSGNCYDVLVDGNIGAYIGENEVFRYGATLGLGDIMEKVVVTNNHAEHCGWLLPIPGNRQNSYDLFCYNHRNCVFSNNTSVNSTGGCLEIKTSLINTMGSQRYEKLRVTGNHSLQYYGVNSHYSFRHDSSGVPNNNSEKRATGLIFEGNTAENDLYSEYFVTLANAFSVTIDSKTVVVTHAGHKGQNGDFIMPRGLTLPIGGIPAHELMRHSQITKIDADRYSYQVATAATVTVTGGSAGGIIYEHFRNPVLAPNSLTTSSNQVLRINIPGHGASTSDDIDLSGVEAFAGLPAAAFNRRFDIRTIVDANTIEMHLSVLATATVAGGGGVNVAYRIHKDGQSSSGVWLQAYDEAVLKANTFINIDTVFLLEGNSDGVNPEEPLVNTTITGNTATGGRYFAVFNRGYVDNCKLLDNEFDGYGSFATYGSNLIAAREGVWTRNESRVRNGMTALVGTFWYGRSLNNVIIRKNAHEGDGYSIYDLPNSGVGEVTAGVKLLDNDFKVIDPKSGGLVIPALQIFRLDGGGSWQIQQNRVIPAPTLASTIVTVGGATLLSYKNDRGGSVAIPTFAGSLGDVVSTMPPTVGASDWDCTTAGGVGVAVWTPRS